MRGRVLIIAGSDSGGGAGIQADIKTVTALGGYAATAITALTAQDTNTVHEIFPVPAAFVRRQIEVVLADIGADAIKTGMLNDADVIQAISETLAAWPGIPLVVDPVMVAKGGASLLGPGTLDLLRTTLIPRATLLTPNLPEAELLTGLSIRSRDDMRRAAEQLLKLGPRAVLLKGGHLEGKSISDLLLTPDGEDRFDGPRIDTRSTHGTGCTLASGIATGLAQGLGLDEAVARARAYVVEALRRAPGFGHGHGPLNHAHTVRPFGATD